MEERLSSEDLRRSGGTRGDVAELLRREKDGWMCCCGDVGWARGANRSLEGWVGWKGGGNTGGVVWDEGRWCWAETD